MSAGSFVVLTGASGAGKTAIASVIEAMHPEFTVFHFDTIGVPSAEVMAAFGAGYQPGGAWQRAMTLRWFERIAPILEAGANVLFEGQMRIAFIEEALATYEISNARVILMECDDETRTDRLTNDRRQPELASDSMRGWSRYLRQEALKAKCEILDTGVLPLAQSVRRVVEYLQTRTIPASAIHASTVRAYRETEYRVLGSSPAILQVGVASPELAALHREHRTQCSAFITACNPLGVLVPDAINAERQRALQAELLRQGLSMIPGVGQHPSGAWSGEPSFLVLGVSRDAAEDLGQQFEQNAIVWAGSDSVPELILLR